MSTFGAVSTVLARRSTPLKIFFRNDDGGWADERLQVLASGFVQRELPLDIAVIPDALSSQSIDVITALLDAGGRIAIHQHGLAHTNHQRSGRSCEFGSDRNRRQQQNDIAQGQRMLAEVFGQRVCPVFTPPWNRCTRDTAEAIQALGFHCLSRIAGSDDLGASVAELPVTIDWLKKRKGVRLTTTELIDYLCALLDTDTGTIGVMLHHEPMDRDNRALLWQFIETVAQSPRVSFHSMMDIARDQRA